MTRPPKKRLAAEKLFETLATGPISIDDITKGRSHSEPERLRENYDLWFRSWVRNQLIDLIPQLSKEAAERIEEKLSEKQKKE